jgi:hypothetical protein
MLHIVSSLCALAWDHLSEITTVLKFVTALVVLARHLWSFVRNVRLDDRRRRASLDTAPTNIQLGQAVLASDADDNQVPRN